MADASLALQTWLALRSGRGRSDSKTDLSFLVAPLEPGDPSGPKLELNSTELFSISMNGNCITHLWNRYEKFTQFRKCLGNSQAATPLAIASTVYDATAEIDKIMMNADRQIQEKLKAMKEDVERFTVEVAHHANTHWYRNLEDVTVFAGDQFLEMLRIMRIQDYGDFAAYLKETLPTASKKSRRDHEFHYMNFVDKARILLDKVVSQAKHHDAFSLVATVKADVFVLRRRRIPVRPPLSALKHIDGQLQFLLDAHSAHAEVDDYWDFAASWRRLVNAREDMRGDHGILLSLLNPIRQKAEAEIRYQTDVAINRRLPQELADLVFEWAMMAEEVPLEDEER